MNKTHVRAQVNQSGQSEQKTQSKSEQVCWVKLMSQTGTNQKQADRNELGSQVKHNLYSQKRRDGMG